MGKDDECTLKVSLIILVHSALHYFWCYSEREKIFFRAHSLQTYIKSIMLKLLKPRGL